jgi:hypothetical protein
MLAALLSRKVETLRLNHHEGNEVRPPLPRHSALRRFLPSLLVRCFHDSGRNTNHLAQLESFEFAALLGWNTQSGRL